MRERYLLLDDGISGAEISLLLHAVEDEVLHVQLLTDYLWCDRMEYINLREVTVAWPGTVSAMGGGRSGPLWHVH